MTDDLFASSAPVVIAVHPAQAVVARRRLFATLEGLFAVRFVPWAEAQADAVPRALIAWTGDGAPGAAPDGPDGTLAAPHGLPLPDRRFLIPLSPDVAGAPAAAQVRFSGEAPLDRRLWDQTFIESRCPDGPGIETCPGDYVMASAGGRALWARRREGGAEIDLVAATPPEPDENETLWAWLSRDRFLAALPLIHFLREALAPEAWTAPPLRANLVIDDPNLRFARYGYLRYDRLLEHARAHNHHVTLATVPLDLWSAHGPTARMFRENRDRLSLTLHGVHHTTHEMGRVLTVANAMACLSDGLRRVERFEQRWQVPVSRVMTVPHGRVSAPLLRAMARLEIEAICISGKPHPCSKTLPACDLMAGLDVAELPACGVPVFLRDSMVACCASGDPAFRQDQVLKAFLNQPIVFNAHHQDFRRGLDDLAELADFVNRLGDVRWMALDDIARGNYRTRLEGGRLRVRLFSRRVRLTVPEGADVIEVAMGPTCPASEPLTLRCPRWREKPALLEPGQTVTFPALPAGEELDIALSPLDAVDVKSIPPAGATPWALFRRLLCESRDQLSPLFRP